VILKIKITLTVNQLSAVNSIWRYVAVLDTTNPETRVLVSISNYLAEKLIKKQLSMQFGNKTKTIITLDYYKAYFLEKMIRTVLENMPTAYANYEGRQLINLAGELNQKLA
tara:strand:- start:392 stop:724 length:333 start_codon:yes stop_codon:yes gene_type:complete